MQKIPTIFKRDEVLRGLVTDERNPDCDWVFNGEGIATRKFDGTCCLVRNGRLFKRYEVKKGGKPPANFEPANEIDENTGKQQGWVPVAVDAPENKWHMEAWRNQECQLGSLMGEHTFELCGPKIQGNLEAVYVQSEVGPDMHLLVPHGKFIYLDCPVGERSIQHFIIDHNIEGIVWHHQDGRMAKIKGRDFGINRAAITHLPLSP